MKLFSKNNDLVKRIMNLILVVWIIIAIVVAYGSVVDLVFDYNDYTYEEYKIKYCANAEENNCKQQYDSEKFSRKRSHHNQTKVLINSIGNVIIVGMFIFLLNREKIEKEK